MPYVIPVIVTGIEAILGAVTTTALAVGIGNLVSPGTDIVVVGRIERSFENPTDGGSR